MRFNKFIIFTIILGSSVTLFAQRPMNPLQWIKDFDTNRNGSLEADEYRAAADRFFDELDHNQDGVIDEVERPKNHRPRHEGDRDGDRDGRPPRGEGRGEMGRDGRDGMRPPIPPFFVMESIKRQGNVTRDEYTQRANEQFTLMDADKNGSVTEEEAAQRLEQIENRRRNENPPLENPPLDSPTAQFIGAEMRFGDKLVKNAPFSAETVIENSRRLYDGSTITKQTKGAFYRDTTGKTRREQPLESIGGFSVVGENGSPQKLIFINDFSAKMQYFLDANRKIARKNPLPDNLPPLAEPKDGKTES
nr:hypothetical protein [Pyrinomonadaceae bacterium]